MTCLAELVGYYLTASVGGLGLGSSSLLALWVACAVLDGPTVAGADFWWRTGPARARHLAPLLAACFALEGARYLVVLDAAAKAALWFGITLAIALMAAGRASLRLAPPAPEAGDLGHPACRPPALPTEGLTLAPDTLERLLAVHGSPYARR